MVDADDEKWYKRSNAILTIVLITNFYIFYIIFTR